MAATFDFDSHRRAAEAEDVAFLMTVRGGGLTLEAACERVGVKPDTLDQRVRRHTDERTAS